MHPQPSPRSPSWRRLRVFPHFARRCACASRRATAIGGPGALVSHASKRRCMGRSSSVPSPQKHELKRVHNVDVLRARGSPTPRRQQSPRPDTSGRPSSTSLVAPVSASSCAEAQQPAEGVPLEPREGAGSCERARHVERDQQDPAAVRCWRCVRFVSWGPSLGGGHNSKTIWRSTSAVRRSTPAMNCGDQLRRSTWYVQPGIV